MEYNELRNKIVININNGEILGNVIDLKVNMPNGNIYSFFVAKNKAKTLFKNRMINDSILEIQWENVVTIGIDTILVNIYR